MCCCESEQLCSLLGINVIDWLEHLIPLFHELHPTTIMPASPLNNKGQTWGKQNSPCSEGDEDDASRSWRNIAISPVIRVVSVIARQLTHSTYNADEAETPMFGLIIAASVLLVGALLVAYGTVVRNRWGIDLQPVNCPCCQVAVRQVRKPESLREALWGGST